MLLPGNSSLLAPFPSWTILDGPSPSTYARYFFNHTADNDNALYSCQVAVQQKSRWGLPSSYGTLAAYLLPRLVLLSSLTRGLSCCKVKWIDEALLPRRTFSCHPFHCFAGLLLGALVDVARALQVWRLICLVVLGNIVQQPRVGGIVGPHYQSTFNAAWAFSRAALGLQAALS